MRTAPETSATGARSLCESCTFVRHVQGRLGQRYLLCQNETIAAKYPAQPVLACVGYAEQELVRDDWNSAG
jgi:hypothetical protein